MRGWRVDVKKSYGSLCSVLEASAKPFLIVLPCVCRPGTEALYTTELDSIKVVQPLEETGEQELKITLTE